MTELTDRIEKAGFEYVLDWGTEKHKIYKNGTRYIIYNPKNDTMTRLFSYKESEGECVKE